MHGASRKGKQMQGSNEKSEEGAEKGKKTKTMEAAMHRQEQSRSRERERANRKHKKHKRRGWMGRNHGM